MPAVSVNRGWLAVGIAVSVIGGVSLLASASGGATPAALVPIVPCRLMDTRPQPANNVGTRATPVGPAETHVVVVRGTTGNCQIPESAVAVSMNVTAANPTASSYLTVFPADAERPTASSLNYRANQGATPNAVTVKLSADGKVAFFNLIGTVDVIADVVGYYEPTTAGGVGPAGAQGPTGPAGGQGPAGPTGPLPTAYIATLGSSGAAILPAAESAAATVLSKNLPAGSYLVRLDAQLDTTGALYFLYHCKLQYLTYPALIFTPYTDVPGSQRTVSWRLGREVSGGGAPVSISMQGGLIGGSLGATVRMVCWGTWDGASPPVVDYGFGVSSAVLVVEPIGGFG